jgi:hypothetical protein
MGHTLIDFGLSVSQFIVELGETSQSMAWKFGYTLIVSRRHQCI